MTSERVWSTINISLGLIIVILSLNLAGVELPTLGKAQYWLDQEEPVCVVNWKDEFTLWPDLDRCCFEARKQLDCRKEKLSREGLELDWVCETGPQKVWTNNKAYRYCQQLRIW